jgi:hypothetical protein
MIILVLNIEILCDIPNYLSLSTDGTTPLFVSIDESNNEGFDLIIAEIITVNLEKSQDGSTFQIFMYVLVFANVILIFISRIAFL